MKKIIASFLLSMFCIFAFSATYLDVWMQWNYNTTSTNLVKNFIVYCARDGSTNFIPVVTVSATTNVAKARIQITPGITKSLTFKVTAKNDIGESEFSNTDSVPKNIPSIGPSNLIIYQSTIFTNQ